MATMTRLAPVTRSMAPPMPGTSVPGTIQLTRRRPDIDLQAAQHGQVKVAAANRAEGEGAVEAGCSRNGRDEASAGIDEVRVLHAPCRSRAHSGEAVLGLEEDADSRRQETGDVRGQKPMPRFTRPPGGISLA